MPGCWHGGSSPLRWRSSTPHSPSHGSRHVGKARNDRNGRREVFLARPLRFSSPAGVPGNGGGDGKARCFIRGGRFLARGGTMKRRFFVRAADVPSYHPANHSGTTNKRLVGAENVGAKNVELVLGVIEKGRGADPHAHPGMEQVCYLLEGRALAEV